MAEYKSNYTGEQIDGGIAKANTAVQPEDLPAEVTETTVASWGFTKNTGTYSKPSEGIPENDLSNEVKEKLTNIKSVDVSNPEDYDNGAPTVAVLNDIATHEYQALRIYNIPIDEDSTIEVWYFINAMMHSENTQLRKYSRFDESNETYGTAISVMTIQKNGLSDATMTEDEYPLGNNNQ